MDFFQINNCCYTPSEGLITQQSFSSKPFGTFCIRRINKKTPSHRAKSDEDYTLSGQIKDSRIYLKNLIRHFGDDHAGR